MNDGETIVPALLKSLESFLAGSDSNHEIPDSWIEINIHQQTCCSFLVTQNILYSPYEISKNVLRTVSSQDWKDKRGPKSDWESDLKEAKCRSGRYVHLHKQGREASWAYKMHTQDNIILGG